MTNDPPSEGPARGTAGTAPPDRLRLARAAIEGGRFADARAEIDRILADDPANRDALYMKAVSARYTDDLATALDAIGTLIDIAPDYGRAYQEEGHIRAQMGDTDGALAAYRRACQFNPALEASWQRASALLAAKGHADEARKADRQARWLRAAPRPVVAAMNHIHEGRLHQAEQMARAFLQRNPRHVDGMRMLADIAARLNIIDEAEFILESAVVFEPDNVPARLDYIQALRKRHKYAAALEQAEILFNRFPDDPAFQSHLAIECMHNNEFERAFALFDQVLERLPHDPATLVSRGHALKTYGHHDEAVASYQHAAEIAPDLGDAWFGLANLKTYRFNDSEIEAMRAAERAERISYNARVQICFSLGKALEDRGAYDDAFAYYERGNRMKRVQSRYDADQMTAELAAQETHCTRDLFDRHQGHGAEAPDPIFILGLPRAGSTLLEQILASHSKVDGTQELPNILSLAHRLRRQTPRPDDGDSDQISPGVPASYPANLHHLSADDFRKFGEAYLEDTRVHRAGAPFFIDKMPNNFRHIALIHLILPNAKIIDARRAPLASCFSGFKQLFAEGQEFTYGLTEIGQYYRDYVRLMRHWDAVLPGKILHVQHEDVIDNLDHEVRRILDFCGLAFEPQCLEFYKTSRSVRTASSEQVRRPINRSGVDQWRPFEHHLDPLKEALGEALTEYRA